MGYSGKLRLLTILEKKVFRTSAVSLSELITSPSSINVIFALNGEKQFDSSQKFLVFCSGFFI